MHAGRRRIERDAGQYARENAGVSSGTQVRILRTENPRIPEEGSSALGKSGPKARPKGAADGQQVENPVLHRGAKDRRRRQVESGGWKSRSKRSRRQERKASAKART